MNVARHFQGFFACMLLWSFMGLACRLSDVSSADPNLTLPTPPPFATPILSDPDLPLPDTIEAETAVPQPDIPMMTAVVNLNVRRGPSTIYDVVTALQAGESIPILGRSPDGFWWKIDCPSGFGGECWSSARSQYSTATHAQNIPVALVPPSPTATYTATPTATSTPTQTPTQTATPTSTATVIPTAYP